MQNGRLLVDFYSLLEIHRRILIVLLFLINISESPPSVVVSLVAVDGFLVALSSLFKILIIDVLMTTQGVRVREIFVDLNRFAEILEGCLVLFLEGVAITKNAPSFWCVQTTVHGILGPVNEIGLLLEMPEAG